MLQRVLDLALVLGVAPLVFGALAVALSLRSAAPTSRRRQAVFVAVSWALSLWLTRAMILPGFRSTGEPADSPLGALAVARAAHAGHWPMSPLLADATRSMQSRAELQTFGDLLAIETGAAPAGGAESDRVLAAGTPVHALRPPLATFEAWTTHDFGVAGCLLIAYFRPATAVDGSRVWLHQYPGDSHEYVDGPHAMAAETWRSDELGWEVFRLAGAGPLALYAGIESGDLGPAVRLGAVNGCHAVR